MVLVGHLRLLMLVLCGVARPESVLLDFLDKQPWLCHSFALNEEGVESKQPGEREQDPQEIKLNCLTGIVPAGVPGPSGSVPVAAAMQKQVSGL